MFQLSCPTDWLVAFLRMELHRPGAKSRYHFTILRNAPKFQCGQENQCKHDALALSLSRVGAARAPGQA
eukprot:11156361-Lingulodinium_polyedra.AAC.1